MKNFKTYYISQGKTPEEHLFFIEKMVSASVKWVQLRIKNEPKKILLETALKAKRICDTHRAHLIVNDYPEIAKVVNAAGVHLGKGDLCPLLARKILGNHQLIGGTANTLEDCHHLIEKKVDYIGLGPFRFTITKKKLSPVLGVEGYRNILESLRQNKYQTPVLAIGGITLEDIPALTRTGIHGVAISGFLNRQKNIQHTIQEINNHFISLYYAT